jgi:hypothetical protein
VRKGFYVYPNPFSEGLNITLPLTLAPGAYVLKVATGSETFQTVVIKK